MKVDAPLPRGYVQVRKVLSLRKKSVRGVYEPGFARGRGRILIAREGDRHTLAHEKGHFVWHRRMSPAMRRAFADAVVRVQAEYEYVLRFPDGTKRVAPRFGSRTTTRALAKRMGLSSDALGGSPTCLYVEEVWAETFAIYKRSPKSLCPPLRRVVRKIVNSQAVGFQ